MYCNFCKPRSLFAQEIRKFHVGKWNGNVATNKIAKYLDTRIRISMKSLVLSWLTCFYFGLQYTLHIIG